MTTVSVIGAGAWGTAMALAASRADNQTILWTRSQDHGEEMISSGRNDRYLPEVPLSEKIKVTWDLEEACRGDIILLVTPAQTIRDILISLKPHIRSESYLVLCSKGIEIKSGLLMSEVVAEIMPDQSPSVLSGPSFAHDVALNLPVAATFASAEITRSRWLASSLGNNHLRLYPSDDIMGVEIAGALKNVLAIAAGISTSMGFGESARAALISRGITEVAKLGMAKGARIDTFLGLAGLGDLLLSCTSSQSRNMSLGLEIGKGRSLDHIMKEGSPLTEGVYTAKAVLTMAKSYDLELPLCQAVYRILHERKPIHEEIEELLSRPLKMESII
jgi:glycerol-3-phosphate dehydrogenase (NAD(P)+)